MQHSRIGPEAWTEPCVCTSCRAGRGRGRCLLRRTFTPTTVSRLRDAVAACSVGACPPAHQACPDRGAPWRGQRSPVWQGPLPMRACAEAMLPGGLRAGCMEAPSMHAVLATAQATGASAPVHTTGGAHCGRLDTAPRTSMSRTEVVKGDRNGNRQRKLPRRRPQPRSHHGDRGYFASIRTGGGSF